MTPIAFFIALIFLHSLVSGRLARTVVTPPIVFTAAGFLLYLLAPDVLRKPLDSEFWLHISEAGLVLLLFTDASRTDLQALNKMRNLPARLSTGVQAIHFSVVLHGVSASPMAKRSALSRLKRRRIVA